MAIVVQIDWVTEWDATLGAVAAPHVVSVSGLGGGKANVATQIERAIRFRADGTLTVDWAVTPFEGFQHRFIVKMPSQPPSKGQKTITSGGYPKGLRWR